MGDTTRETGDVGDPPDDPALTAAVAAHRPVQTLRRTDSRGIVGAVFECAAAGCSYSTRLYRVADEVDAITHARFAMHVAEVLTGRALRRADSPTRLFERPPVIPEVSLAAAPSGVPVLEWRGREFLTADPSVLSRCTSCGETWAVPSTVSNALARELAADWQLEAQGAGSEPDARADDGDLVHGHRLRRLVALFRLAACPRCAGTQVMLSRP